MKIPLMILFLTSAFFAYSQKCKFDFEKKDPFSGKMQKGSSSVLAGFGPNAFRIIFQAEEKKYLVGLYIRLPGVKNENYIQSGNTLSLALDNGEVLTLRAANQYLPNTQAMDGAIATYYTPMYTSSEDEIKRLTVSGIKAAKLKLGSQPLMAEVSQKHGDKIKIAASCILN